MKRVERSKQSGLDAVVLSEHDAIWSPDAVRMLARRHNFKVLSGLEVSTEGGHILVYGLHRYADEMRQSDVLASHVRRASGVMVAAHPYRAFAPYDWRAREGIRQGLSRAEQNPAYRLVQAIEVVNGHGNPNENGFSQRLASLMGLPGTAGTDSHQASDIGKAATHFEREIRDEAELIEEIAAGRCWAVDLTRGSLTEDRTHHGLPEYGHERADLPS